MLVTMKIADLVPAPYNPRKKLRLGDPEYEKLKKSIAEFGVVDPIIWNKQTNRVVGGHQRLQVMQDLGMAAVKAWMTRWEQQGEQEYYRHEELREHELERKQLYKAILSLGGIKDREYKYVPIPLRRKTGSTLDMIAQELVSIIGSFYEDGNDLYQAITKAGEAA